MPDEPMTLAVDIGGTGIKASVLDAHGAMLVERVRVATPHPCPPDVLLDHVAQIAAGLPAYDRVSIGFPGVVRGRTVLTAPHFEDAVWRDYPLADAIEKRLGKPTRMLNDAEVQGLACIEGRGLEFVLTLGTGAGTALFRDGVLMPHLELAHHPVHKRKSYNAYIGDHALREDGVRKWSRKVVKTIAILDALLHYDVLYVGGGNAQKVEFMPTGVRIVSNDGGLTGGVRLWDATFDPPSLLSQSRARPDS